MTSDGGARPRGGSRLVTRQRVAAGMLCLLAAMIAWLLLHPEVLASPSSRSSTCEELDDLNDALDLTSLVDQAVIQARAAQLAAALQAKANAGVAAEGSTEVNAAALVGLRAVMADPVATSGHLAAAVHPLALECGVRLRVPPTGVEEQDRLDSLFAVGSDQPAGRTLSW